MAPLRTITCEDCGFPRLTRRKNTKYCRVCRLSKDLDFIKNKVGTHKCVDCEQRFAPLNRNDDLCRNCELYAVPGRASGTCALCSHSTDSLLSPDIAVCIACAQDPKQRDTFASAVRKKVRQRREAPQQVKDDLNSQLLKEQAAS